MDLVFDIETDDLKATKIWCIVAQDSDSGKIYMFAPHQLESGLELLQSADKLIGHNIIGFDIPVIRRLHGTNLLDKKIIDTLVLSRLFNPVKSSHSLKTWGYDLQFPKIDFDDYSAYSEDMMQYCAQDVIVNYKVYEKLKQESRGFTSESVDLEIEVYKIVAKQREHGFVLDEDLTHTLLAEFLNQLTKTEDEVHKTFKPKIIERTIYPQHTKDGVLKKLGIDKEGQQTRLTDEEYNNFKNCNFWNYWVRCYLWKLVSFACFSGVYYLSCFRIFWFRRTT